MKSLDPSEHAIQSAWFEWWDAKYGSPLAFAIPNAAKRSFALAAYLKKEGMRSGVPDVCVAIPIAPYHGLYMEFKRRLGKVTDEQKALLELLSCKGYKTAVVRGIDEAIRVTVEYLEGNETPFGGRPEGVPRRASDE